MNYFDFSFQIEIQERNKTEVTFGIIRHAQASLVMPKMTSP